MFISKQARRGHPIWKRPGVALSVAVANNVTMTLQGQAALVFTWHDARGILAEATVSIVPDPQGVTIDSHLYSELATWPMPSLRKENTAVYTLTDVLLSWGCLSIFSQNWFW